MTSLKEEIKKVIGQNHCRYCGRLNEKGEYKCQADVEYSTDKILSLLTKKVLKAMPKELDERIAYIKKYRLKGNYTSGFSRIESGECCDKCRMDKKAVAKSGRAVALRLLVGCRDPFQINCKCHIPYRKVATQAELALLQEVKKALHKVLEEGK